MTVQAKEKVRRAGGYACLTLCVLLSVAAAVAGMKPAPGSDAYAPLGRAAQVAPVDVITLGVINPNTADAYELTELPGVGETIAGYIISEREKNGLFFYPEDLTQVKGIGIKKLEGFYGLLDLSGEQPQ